MTMQDLPAGIQIDGVGHTINIGCGRPHGRFRWWSVAAWVGFFESRRNDNVARDIEALRREVEALKSRPASTPDLSSYVRVSDFGYYVGQYPHQCTAKSVASRRRHLFSFLLTIIGLLVGLIWTSIVASGFAHTVIHDGSTAGWIASSIADTSTYAWLFIIGGSLITAIPFGVIGYVIDYFVDSRVTVEVN